MAAQLVRRREILAQGAEPIGWKVGLNAPEAQQKLGIDRPLAGFLTTNGLLEDGTTWSLGDDGEVLVESELAVELGDDARTIAALLPAFELVDPPDLSLELEQILAGDIFHRAVAFGPRGEVAAAGDARILVNGELEHEVTAQAASAQLDEMVAVAAERLGTAGEQLQAGDRIITGVMAPPHKAEPGDRVRLEIDGLGAIELGFAE